ncbi:MAG TPA: folylpolyglutamate synthase/dihydrofolate synthase family protein [Ignavibacteria bacterium]|nr:folylpolyglutamate synthase/dihydrofolate synthase family protein [Ignavibacteria bacterium]
MIKNKFRNYNKCIEYLFGLERAGIKYDLKNIALLLKYLNIPEKKFKSIHIAGTNGKGSVSSILNSVLNEKGFKTGLYTSPHIKDFRERILVNGKYISKKFIIDFTNKLHDEIERIKPSFFEVTTAMAFEYFSNRKVDYAVVETGLGGRLDSTNVLIPVVSVITSICIDHVEFLGKTIKKISAEKAGIIKKNIPIVSGNVTAESEKIFRKTAKEKNSEIIFAEDNYRIDIKKKTERGFIFNAEGNGKNYRNFYFPVIGDYQKHNIKTSLTALDIFCEKENIVIEENEIHNGLKNVKQNSNFHGRFELISEKPKIVIDVSHNLQGIENIPQNLKFFNYKALIIIFAMMNDKQYKESISELLKLKTKKIIFTKPDYKRSAEPDTLLNSVKGNESKIEARSTVKEAFEYAISLSKTNDLILVSGSFFLVSDLLKLKEFKHRKVI